MHVTNVYYGCKQICSFIYVYQFYCRITRVKKEKITSKLSHVSYENSPRLSPPQNNSVDYDAVQYETFQEKENRKSHMYELPVTTPTQQVVNGTTITKTGFLNSKQGVNKPMKPKKPIKPPKSLVKGMLICIIIIIKRNKTVEIAIILLLKITILLFQLHFSLNCVLKVICCLV